ncbi:leucyl aminopeptidase family protein [Clostridium sp. 'deep sea']|uniref:leucyl aminopeptidase family protein n=1 Tax=Clostridium sp. 'deep sea' TaxID=2779445 RepID=UPI0018966DCB|nr:leucyl aminopeptidase family protein [Clostridium sp. 'deep sea']QOR36837.1 leucyl aminopeptidase family protein [Clostridium sp. 'deep sea']
MKINIKTQSQLVNVETRIVLNNSNGQTSEVNSTIINIMGSLKNNNKVETAIKTYNLINSNQASKVISATINANTTNAEEVRLLAGKIRKTTETLESQDVAVSFLNYCWQIPFKKFIPAFVEGFMLAGYIYDKYLSKKKTNSVKNLTIIVANKDLDLVKALVAEAVNLVKWTCVARDLVNEPANFQTPAMLAEQAQNLAKECDVECEIFNENYLAEKAMKAVLAVSQASPNPPRLIVLRYRGNPQSSKILGLVGKGITFDSGGMSLKGKQRLYQMKHDMAGSASVIAAIGAIAKQKLSINVTAVVAACDNLLSGKCYKPGDVIGSMAGKSILIISTDAEGRLTLADAITYAISCEKVTRILDIATLTGGARKMFGGIINPVLCTSEDYFSVLQEASLYSGERFHLMPMLQEARDLLNCNIADIKNSSSSEYMKMIVGGMFIYEFVKELDIPWLHIDIAGSSFSDNDLPYSPAGGTGRAVRSIYHLTKILARENQ